MSAPAILRYLVMSLAALSVLAGCTGLPRGAALKREIQRDAEDRGQGFAFYPVTRDLLSSVEHWPAVNTDPALGWPRAGGGASGQIIAPGDILNIVIWDSAENSLLTSTTQRNVPLGSMTVSPAGRVFLPYAGEVRVAGLGPERARLAIQQQLEMIAPSAQVQVAVESGRQNSVDLVSGVRSPGVYPMPDRNYSVLSLIAAGGGVTTGLRNPRVKLQRGPKVYATSVETLYDRPDMDSVLAGGDKVIVEEDERFFLALGAAGREAVVYYEEETLSALEAIARIGGISDTRADPEGILVLREYPPAALAAGAAGPRETSVVFAIDLTTADGLFSAREMAIYPQDVVLATESPVGSIQVALGLLGSGLGVGTRIASSVR